MNVQRALGAPPALLGLLLLPGCDRARPDPVVVAFADQVVRLSDFERHLQGLEKDGPLDAEVRRALFESYVEERVLAIEARRRGLLPQGAPADQETEAVQRMLLDAAPAGALDEAEIAAYYEKHRDELRRPETVTLHQILVPTENEARDALRRLQKEPKSFAVMARSLSRAPEASTGGLMGTFSRGQLPPELEHAGFALAAGQHSEPIKTVFGFHVLRVDAREPARDQSLEECRDQIRALLETQRSERAVRSFVQGLLARAKVNHEAVEAARRTT